MKKADLEIMIADVRKREIDEAEYLKSFARTVLVNLETLGKGGVMTIAGFYDGGHLRRFEQVFLPVLEDEKVAKRQYHREANEDMRWYNLRRTK